nr:short-chain fatty acyl-CoA regulator family protein [Pseudooceanicola batsensis]
MIGSRIRERRTMVAMRQADLARKVGISASYLNLIEHNRRRIGGKLLLDIAAVLGVEPVHLSEGAEAALVATLREASAAQPTAGAEVETADEFAGRFPGWARLVADQNARIGRLEQAVEALTDRLAHDPHLAASLHEVLSTVTAIHSSASILVETREIEPEWRDRFHRNIHEDSARLAEGAQRLVDELDAGQRREVTLNSPQDEVDAFLDAAGHSFPALEAGGRPEEVLAEVDFGTTAARALARDRVGRIATDAARLPLERLAEALDALPEDAAGREGPDPTVLAEHLGVSPGLVMRRLVALPDDLQDRLLPAAPGLVIADASGTLLYRREAAGFSLPRYGAACPLWPLFAAFTRPMFPIRQRLRLAGRSEGTFLTHAVAEPDQALRADADPGLRAHMLIWPADHDEEEPPRVGVTCRICPRETCASRREPSIMARGA